MNNTRLKIYAILAGTFLLGSAAGGGAAYALSQRDCRRMVAEGREVFERRRLSSLARELDLTDEQQTRVRSIMQRSREDRRRAMQSAFERCGDPLKSHKAKVQSDIRAVLTAEQRTRFDELIDEYGDGFLRGPGRQGPHRHGAPPTHAPPH